jgi:hypothetical protein
MVVGRPTGVLALSRLRLMNIRTLEPDPDNAGVGKRQKPIALLSAELFLLRLSQKKGDSHV